LRAIHKIELINLTTWPTFDNPSSVKNSIITYPYL